MALIVGALGVGMAMQAHLQQKLDSIAIMKCIGGRSNQIIGIYALQTMGLGLAGGLIGVILGGGVQTMFPALIRRYFQLNASWTVDWISALQGILIGLLTTMLFTLPPLLSIRQVRPALIFRREMGEGRTSVRQRIRLWFQNRRESIAAGAVIVLGIGAIAAWLSQSRAWACTSPGHCWAAWPHSPASPGPCCTACAGFGNARPEGFRPRSAMVWPISIAPEIMPARCWWPWV